MSFICSYLKSKSVEEIVAEKSAGMSDAEKAQYWYMQLMALSLVVKALMQTIEARIIVVHIVIRQSVYPRVVRLRCVG